MPATGDPLLPPGGGGTKELGHGTQTGGRVMPVLPLAPFILEGLTEAQVKAIKLRSLHFSQDVCANAAAAYKDIIAIIDV